MSTANANNTVGWKSQALKQASVVVLVCAQAVQGQSPEGGARRLFEEAPERWQEYEAFAENLQGSLVYEITTDGKQDGKGRLEFKNNEKARTYVLQRLEAKASAGRLSGFNSQYSFSLLRRDEHRPWVLERVPSRRKEDSARQPWTEEAIRALRSLLIAGSAPLSELVRQPTFRVVSAQAINRDGVELIRIDFDNAHPVSDDKSYMLVQGGTLFLDPNRFWTLREFTVRHKYPHSESIVRGVLAIQDAAARYPIPKHAKFTTEMTYVSPSRRAVMVAVNDFDLRAPSSLPPDSEFYLSAFGLPEPLGVTAPRPPGWNIWVGVAGLGAFAASALLYKHLRRRQARSRATMG